MKIVDLRTIGATAVLCSAVAGCSSDATEDEVTTQLASRAGFFDARGREWRATGKSELAVSADSEGAFIQRHRPTHKDLDAMSEEEVAVALQPRLLINGQEYTTVEPDTDLAARVLAGKAQAGPSYEGDAPSDSVAHPKVGQIIGVDDRYKLPYGTTYPYRTVASLSDTSGGHTCTATLIGASTAISAAHCYHDGSNWLPTQTWSYGANSTASVVHPYNPSGAYPSTSSNTPVWGCSAVTVPGCWDGSNEDCDYAVIEYSNMYPWTCNYYPGNTLGWLGWGVQSTATLRAYQSELKGYPSDSPCPGGNCQWPILWGQIEDVGQIGPCGQAHQLCSKYDVTGGDSGAALFNMAPGYPEVIGIMWGFYNWDQDYNYLVRLDAGVTNFIATYSAL